MVPVKRRTLALGGADVCAAYRRPRATTALLIQDLPPTTWYGMLPGVEPRCDGLGDYSAAHVTRDLHLEKQSSSAILVTGIAVWRLITASHDKLTPALQSD